MAELKFLKKIEFIRIALHHHGLEHLLADIELIGCWGNAGQIVNQIKDKVPVEILHAIYDTVPDVKTAFQALLYIDSSYQPWIDIVTKSIRYSYYGLREIDRTNQAWRDTVSKSAEYSYMALQDIDNSYQPWRRTVNDDPHYAYDALLRLDAHVEKYGQ